MADVQIAVIDQQNTQLALAAPEETQVNIAVPGVQGPTGEGVPVGGSTNEVLFKQSGTDYDTAWGEITSAMIGDLEIVNADVAAAAAIAGTKISPNFGSQNVTTTGTSTAASFIPTSSTVPTNGVYLPSANNVAISTGGTGKLFIDASGNVSFASAVSTFYSSSDTYIAFQSGTGATAPTRQARIQAISTGGGGNGHSLAFLTNVSGGNPTEYLRLTSDGQLQFKGNGTNGSPGDPAVSFSGSASAKSLVIDSAGRVGLGTSSPDGTIHAHNSSAGAVTANISANLGVFESGLSNGISILTPDGSTSAVFFGSPTSNRFAEITASYTSGLMLVGTRKVGGEVRIVSGNALEAIRIDSSQRVGIGTTSPGTPLHVASSNAVIKVDSTTGTNGAWTQYSNTSGSLYVGLDNSGGTSLGSTYAAHILHTGAYPIVFSTSGIQRAQIDSSGRLLVGTTSDVGGDTDSKLQLVSTGNPKFVIARNDTSILSGQNIGNILWRGNDSNGTYQTCAAINAVADGDHDTDDKPTRLEFSTTADGASSPTERMRINNAGAVLVGATTPVGSETLRVDGTVHALNLPVTANGVFNATDSVYEMSTGGLSLSAGFAKFQGRINPSAVGDSTIAVRFLIDGTTAGAGQGLLCVLKLYDTLLHANVGFFDIKEQHYHFIYKQSSSSALAFPTTPAYSDSATGQSNESATITVSNPTFRGNTQGAPFYVQFDLALGSGRTSANHVVLYELLALRNN